MAKQQCMVCEDTFNTDNGVSTTYQKKRVYLCSDDCREKFKEDPDEYINKIPPTEEIAANAAMTVMGTLMKLMAQSQQAPLGDVQIIRDREIKKITLPEDMSLREADEWLHRKIKEEETIVAISKPFSAFPLDGARAFLAALKEIYGWNDMKTVKTLFGDQPPVFIQVETGYQQYEDVPWGRLEIPSIDGGYLETSTITKDDQDFFCIAGQVKRKHLIQVELIATRTRELLKENSIYRGKAFRLEFSENKSMFGTKKTTTPVFIQPTTLSKDDLILPEVTWKEVNAGIFTMIEKYEEVKRLGIPTKRANLCTGPFGVGKTLCATIASKLCVEHGRTFIYVADASKMVDAIGFARQYAPALIFIEDIDRILTGERDEKIDKILNTIDGADTKGLDILFVLTSNAVERITQAFLRTGRSDMIINFMHPDKFAAARLLARYGIQKDGTNVLNVDGESLLEVGEILASAKLIPADIREVVERSKLFALASANDNHSQIFISRDDLVFASNGVRQQVLMNRPKTTRVPEGFTAELKLVTNESVVEERLIEETLETTIKP